MSAGSSESSIILPRIGMRLYGTIEDVVLDGVGQGRRSSFKLASVGTARIIFVLASAVAAFVLLTATALKEDIRPQVLTSTLASVLADNGTEYNAPNEQDTISFKPLALDVLKGWNVQPDQTDLPEACGVSLYPCVASVGDCTNQRMTTTTQGKLSPATNVCNCFVTAYSTPILLANSESSVITCSFGCLNTIMKYADKYVVSVNGPNDGLSEHCMNAMDIIAKQDFANGNGYIPTDEDDGSLNVEAPDDPKVIAAVEALAEYINTIRSQNCPDLAPVTTNGTEHIVYARKGLADGGRGQYKLEVVFEDQVFFGRVAHLPKEDQMVNPLHHDDVGNFGGRYTVMDTTPVPCGKTVKEQLAVSASGVNQINKQNLPWEATLRQIHEGRTVGSFGLGYRRLSKAQRLNYLTELNTTDFAPPEAYDARDTLPTDQPCKAYEVLNQGSCGSCYAFASAAAYAARMCRFNPGSIGNTVMSPQEMMDCTNGCDGGNAISVYESLIANPAVELWCDPYVQRKGTCGGVCSTGNTYTVQPGSVRSVGGPDSDGVLQMQLELIKNGPGVISLDVYSDFQSYSSGVYVKSQNATLIGTHAVVLVGWGTENGTLYWLIQNSWGPDWGLRGFAKIRRGTNECKIEEEGMSVVKALPPAVCPTSQCLNGAITRKDCTCACQGGWAGPDCSTCSITCANGGILDSGCSECSCPLGFFGEKCEGGFQISPLATCSASGQLITVAFSFGGTATAPTQKSFVAIYNVQETRTMQSLSASMLCGTTYARGSNGGLCPSTGSVSLVAPRTPGDYKIVLAPFIPPNRYGQSGYATVLQTSNVLGQLTVVQGPCTRSMLDRAIASNSPAALLNMSVEAAIQALAAKQAAMTARIMTVQPILAALTADLPASVNVIGVVPGESQLWMSGQPFQVCYRVPQSINTNPKALFLYTGDGNNFYSTALTNAGPNNPLPTDYQGCVTTSLAAGLPSGLYTINLVDISKASQEVLAGFTFNTSQASVRIESFTTQSTRLTLTVDWSVDSNVASSSDTVKILNTKDVVVYWFYTSCGCQNAPGANAVASGSQDVYIFKENAVPGGYVAKFYPAGGAVVGAIATNWINWVSIGW